ncbi:MAG TPA: putative protein N(5)-glutamine methyltransferase [Nocardioides sp.]|nr:putative protein N(5)-glutamine methyltransferase [Nocardioides sp.]
MTDATVRALAEAGCLHPEEEAAILTDAAPTAEALRALVARRAAGEPLEHVVGWAEFRGLRLAVAPGVFVPRPRSDLLVDEAASLVRCLSDPEGAAVVVDLCCGTGAIGAALATELPQVRLHAADIDPRAVACARTNLAPVGGAVHQGDLFDALPKRLRGKVDVLVASPPYVPTDEIRLLASEARRFEPQVALDGGAEGVGLVERIARGARRWLSRGGSLALEVAGSQITRVSFLLEDLGYAPRAVTSDDGAAAVTARLLR